MHRSVFPSAALLLALSVATTAHAEKLVLPVSLEGIDFKDYQGGVTKPRSATSVAELKDLLGETIAARLKSRVDFATQDFVLFQWSGSGQDRIVAVVRDDTVIFQYKRGRTRDLRPHRLAFSVTKGLRWKLETERTNAAAPAQTREPRPEPFQSSEANPAVELMPKAERGDTRAQLALAVRYRDGKGVEKDYAEALRWGRLAADQGDAAALDFIGWMYFRGSGVPRNADIAAGYFKAAADESATGAWNLGQCYFAAQGVEHDVAKALEVWKQAAAMGHGRAASTAAMAYLAGDGVAVDTEQARRLAERAVELDDPSGLVVLGEIHFQAGRLDQARALWTKVAQLKPTGPTGNPEQPSDELAAQQGADLLKLIDYRTRQREPGKLALVAVPHVHQGWNNCGASSCAMFARAQGKTVGGWDYKKLCPSPLGTGTDWGDLVRASKSIGLDWKLITFTPDDEGFEKATTFARKELDAGRPLVIDFKYIGPRYPNGEAGHTLTLVGYLADENLYVLCNPAIPTPGLQLITAADLKHYWRSDHYGELSNNILSRPAIVMDTQRP